MLQDKNGYEIRIGSIIRVTELEWMVISIHPIRYQNEYISYYLYANEMTRENKQIILFYIKKGDSYLFIDEIGREWEVLS